MGEQEKPQDDGITDELRKQLQELAKEREHRKWLVELVKRWATFAAAIIVGTGLVWDAASRIIRNLVEHSSK